MQQDIILEKNAPVASLYFNNPGKLNALSPGMVASLLGLIRELEDDDDIHTIVLRGTGGNFSSGADLSALEELTPHEALRFHKKMNEIVYLIRHSGKIYISALEGYALGGAFELSLSTDIRISAEDAILGQPEINVGLNAGAGGNAILPRLVGTGSAMYMVLTGERITAHRAFELGIVQLVADRGELESELNNLATRISKLTRESVELSKLAVNGALEASPAFSMDFEALVFSMLNGSAATKDRMRKFLTGKREK